MLKAVVQYMHGAAEPAFGDSPGRVAARRHQHGGSWHGARQHLRLVTGALDAGEHPAAIADNHDTLVGDLSGIAAAQDRWALAHLEQHARDFGRERRFAAAANREIADADDGRGEPPPQIGPALVVAPACARDLTVEEI